MPCGRLRLAGRVVRLLQEPNRAHAKKSPVAVIFSHPTKVGAWVRLKRSQNV